LHLAPEILDPADVPVYEDAGVDCIQIGEPNSKNQALLNRLRTTSLPVIHKRGNSLDTEAYMLWVERMMSSGKENVILCERGIASSNRYTRNTLDVGSIAAFRYQLSGLPIAVDASHATGIRDLVHPATLAGIHVFFPDPWPKTRHQKRRLVQPEFAALAARKLAPGGYLHAATDWPEYAEQMLAVLQAEPRLQNTADGFASRPACRPLTKFERRGLGLGHAVRDLLFRRRQE